MFFTGRKPRLNPISSNNRILAALIWTTFCMMGTGCIEGPVAFISGLSGPVVSGRVTNQGGQGVAGVVVGASGVREAGVTDANGRYSVRVPSGWAGEIDPDKANMSFQPGSIRIENVTRNITGNDFVALYVAGAEPIGGFGQAWLDAGPAQVVFIPEGQSLATVHLDGSRSQLSQGSRVEWRSSGVPVGTTLVTTIELPPGEHLLDLVMIPDNGEEISTSVMIKVVSDLSSVLYVDGDHPSADDNNPGTRDLPMASIQGAINLARPGDTVAVRSATYTRVHPSVNRPVISMQGIHGTAEKPITITADTGETPIITGVKPGSSVGNTGWEIVDCSWIQINGFTFENFNGVGLDIQASSPGATHHITVTRCVADHCSQGPNTFVGALRGIGPIRHVRFDSCMVSNSSTGIELRESPVQTRETAAVPPRAGNNAPGSPGGAYTSDLAESQWTTWNGWDQIAPRYCAIENCLSFDNRQVPEHSDGFGTRYAVDCTIRNNIAFGNADDNFDLLGGTRLTITRNIAFNADPMDTESGDGNGIKVGVRGGLDCLVAYNISFDNRRMGLDMGDTERGRVFHNTIVDNGDGHPNGFGLWFEGGRSATGHQVMLNILRRNGLNTSRGDYGADRNVSFSASNANSFSDGNDSNFAGPSGPDDRINDNVMFAEPNLSVDTTFSPAMSVDARIAHIREQVERKFKLTSGSPLRGSAVVTNGVNDDVTTAGGNWGAVQE